MIYSGLIINKERVSVICKPKCCKLIAELISQQNQILPMT